MGNFAIPVHQESLLGERFHVFDVNYTFAQAEAFVSTMDTRRYRIQSRSPVKRFLNRLSLSAALLAAFMLLLMLADSIVKDGASSLHSTVASQVNDSDLPSLAGAQPDVGTTEALPKADVTAPSIPSNLKELASNVSGVTLSWDASSDEESGLAGYRVLRNGELIAIVTEPWLLDNDLVERTRYVYEVSAMDNALPPNESVSQKIIVTTPSMAGAGL